jgi:hypothetical protein
MSIYTYPSAWHHFSRYPGVRRQKSAFVKPLAPLWSPVTKIGVYTSVRVQWCVCVYVCMYVCAIECVSQGPWKGAGTCQHIEIG